MFTLSIILYSTFSCISFTFHGVTLTEVLTLADTIGSYGISEPGPIMVKSIAYL